MGIITPILKLLDTGLYIGDMVSDIGYSVFLHSICLYNYFWCSIAFLVSSYLTTVLGLKFFVFYNESFIFALIYPIITLKIILRKLTSQLPIKRTHIFGFKVKETSEESKVTDIYLDNIKTYEANSEATVQLGLNVVICYFYGFENVIQIIRTTFSVISIYKCLSTRYAFLQYKVEPDFGIVMNAMAKHFIYVMSIFLIIFMVMFEKVVEFYIPLWSLVILVASFHPLILRIALLFPCIRKSKLDYIFTILGLLIFGFYIALYGCCFTSLYNATYENEYSTNVPNIHNGGNFCTKRRTTIFFIPKGYVPFKPISIPFDTFKLFYWIWIPALAILLLLILDVLRAFTKHDLLSKIFGPPVTLKEFLEGPRLQDPQLQEDQLNGNQDNVQDNIPMTKIDKIDENLESMNFCKHLENGNCTMLQNFSKWEDKLLKLEIKSSF